MHSMPHSMPLRRLIPVFLLTLLLLPAAALAQDATITGTITDATGGVLPGVTITATHEATGNTFVAVPAAPGAGRSPPPPGRDPSPAPGEPPGADRGTSPAGPKFDPRQMQALPLNGRNWID